MRHYEVYTKTNIFDHIYDKFCPCARSHTLWSRQKQKSSNEKYNQVLNGYIWNNIDLNRIAKNCEENSMHRLSKAISKSSKNLKFNLGFSKLGKLSY